MDGFIFLLIVVVVVVIMAALRGDPLRGLERFPYERRDEFLSAAERSFYGVLCMAVEADQVVLCKIRLADLVRVDPLCRGREFWQHFNRISGKHIDFVVCDRATMEPVYCVELDDRSHQARRRRERDRFVEGVMEAAGVRLVRMPCRARYGIDEVRGMIKTAAWQEWM